MYQAIPWKVMPIFNVKRITSMRLHASEDFFRDRLSTLFCL